MSFSLFKNSSRLRENMFLAFQVLHNFIVKTAFGHHNSLKQFIKLKFIGKIFNVNRGLKATDSRSLTKKKYEKICLPRNQSNIPGSQKTAKETVIEKD